MKYVKLSEEDAEKIELGTAVVMVLPVRDALQIAYVLQKGLEEDNVVVDYTCSAIYKAKLIEALRNHDISDHICECMRHLKIFQHKEDDL